MTDGPVLKRKRDDVEEDDLKLKEFLEVMQPANKTNKWDVTTDLADMVSQEPPHKIQAREMPEDESDQEYETVPKKTARQEPARPTSSTAVPLISPPVVQAEQILDPGSAVAVDATDDDWLRSRTNRLLDLVEPEDIIAPSNAQVTEDKIAFETFEEEPLGVPEQDRSTDPVDDQEEESDPTLTAIRSTGRLFVRNLPYTASEQDLRDHFAPFGALEEVCLACFPLFLLLITPLHDEYPDRDSLCFSI